jgi:hypothetical protein
MIPIFTLWFVVGLSAGAAQAWLLWHAAQPPFQGAAWHLPRTLLVGGVLFASALFGGLLPTVTGWVTSYFATVGMVAMRIPK